MTAPETPLPPDPELSDVGDLPLAAEFPQATDEDWLRLAAGVLRKAGLADADTPLDRVPELLGTVTYDGLRLAPLYPTRATPGLVSYTRDATATHGWDVRERHADPDAATTREAILADLENGVTSLWLALGTGGLAVEELGSVLDGVYLDLAGVVLDAGDQTGPAADALTARWDRTGVAATAVTGNLGADPLGWTARTGASPDYTDLRALAQRCAAGYPGVRAVTVDATPYHDAGGSDAQELALSLATGVAYLRELTGAGLGVPVALGQLEFRYAATADQFGTIAKLRAARRLWARVAQACGAPGQAAQRQHAVTSSAMMTVHDPWTNMLRTTVACFAAGVGGADAVTVQPFDACLGLPDPFARRIARNTQSVLLEEAHVGRVLDPAGGSGYVRARTEQLARAAWTLFTEVERAGGMAAALASGMVAQHLAQTWEQRAANLAHQVDPVTGVSAYPNLAETLPRRAPTPAQPSGGLPRHRYAEQFEALRERADAYAAKHGAAPTVFLATLGPVAAHTARAGYAANLFAAGGIATASSGPVTDPGEMAALFAASGASLVCLCGTDKAYAELAGPMAQALAGGAGAVWLAGRPASYPGVDRYLYSGVDAVAVLHDALDLLETS